MWEQARARAEETGSIVVWCDGGEGGVSGVAGGGYTEPMQIGQGSWTRTVGLPFPLESHNTFYVFGGNWMAFGVAWATLGAGWGAELLLSVSGSTVLRGASGAVKGFIKRMTARKGPETRRDSDEERNLLED